MNKKETIISISKVSKYFENTCALKNIDLSIQNGEFLTLLGPSGCGKTTILRLLSGFEQPCSGDIFINGKKNNTVPPEKRKVNTVFQHYALFPHMTVEDNVAFGLKMQGCPKQEIQERVINALKMVHLEDLAKRKPSQLSGGQQQRVAIARAVINNPLLLLLDEPFSALDFKLRKKMQLEIKHLQRKLGITFVFVTHDQEEAFAMSDRVVVMNHGQIVQIGSPQEIYEEPANMFVAKFVGDINILKAKIITKINQSPNNYEVELNNHSFTVCTKKEFTPGDFVNVLLRPEDLKVYGKADGLPEEPYLIGIIEETVYKGATVDILIKLNSGQELMAAEFFNEDDEDIIYTPGDKVAVTWVDGWEVVLLDEQA